MMSISFSYCSTLSVFYICAINFSTSYFKLHWKINNYIIGLFKFHALLEVILLCMFFNYYFESHFSRNNVFDFCMDTENHLFRGNHFFCLLIICRIILLCFFHRFPCMNLTLNRLYIMFWLFIGFLSVSFHLFKALLFCWFIHLGLSDVFNLLGNGCWFIDHYYLPDVVLDALVDSFVDKYIVLW